MFLANHSNYKIKSTNYVDGDRIGSITALEIRQEKSYMVTALTAAAASSNSELGITFGLRVNRT